MSEYIILVLMIAVPGLFYAPRASRRLDGPPVTQVRHFEKIHLFICGAYMLYLLAFRGVFSTDYNNYNIIFNTIAAMRDPMELLRYDDVEIGYTLLNKLVSLFTGDFRYVIIVCAVITLLPMFRLTDYSPNAWVSLFIYVVIGAYFQAFNVIRQMMSASIFSLAIPYLYRDEKRKYFLIVLLAATFHMTALIMIPCFFLIRFSQKKLKIWQYVLIYGLLSGSIAGMYFMYQALLKGLSLVASENTTVYTLQNILINLVLVAGSFILYLKGRAKEKPTMEMNITFAGLLMWGLASALSTEISYAIRISSFFLPFAMLALPMQLARVENKSQRMLLSLLIVAAGLFFFIRYSFGSTSWVSGW